VVLGYLARVAQEMSGRRRGAAEDLLVQRVSKLIEDLDPEALRRLLETGADHAERRNLCSTPLRFSPPMPSWRWSRPPAQVSHQTISHNLLRLLHKLALHAEEGAPEIRAAAEGALGPTWPGWWKTGGWKTPTDRL